MTDDEATGSDSGSAAKKAPAKKTAAKKAAAKKTAAKKTATTKTAAKKPSESAAAKPAAESTGTDPVVRFGRVRADDASTAEKASTGASSAIARRRLRGGGLSSLPQAGRRTGIALALASLVVAGLWFADWRGDQAADDRRDAASTAVTSMTRILTFKPSTVEEEVKAERALVTGSFAKEFEASDLAANVIKNERTVNAEIVRAGVESASGDKVVVILFANITQRSPQTDETKVSGSRMRVVMKKVDGSWKISEYESL